MTAPARVLLDHAFFPDLVEELVGSFEVTIDPPVGQSARLGEARAVCTLLSSRVDQAFLDAAPALEVVANFAVGVDNIDLEACRARGVIVTNTPDVLTRATAEMALALLFACARRLVEGDQLCRRGAFDGWSPDLLLGQQVAGRRALILGAGRIGRATAGLLSAVGLDVTCGGRELSGERLDAALEAADVVSVHVPYTDETHHLLDEARLRRIGPTGIVINTARGPVIDEAALVRVLDDGGLFAAGLDVFEREPAIEPGLLTNPRAVLAPHLGSATITARRGMARLALGSIRDVLDGRAPAHRVA